MWEREYATSTAFGLQSLKTLTLQAPYKKEWPAPGLPVLLLSWKKTGVTLKRAFNEGTCISFLLLHNKLPQT